MRRFITKIIFLTSLFIMPASIFAQNKNLVTAENFNISQEEFLRRFELTPRIQNSSNIDEEKKEFLYTLIAEKLWLAETRQNNYGDNKNLNLYLKNIEKMNVRDAFFKDEIERKVILTNDEINSEMQKQRTILYFSFLFSESKKEIDSLYEQLVKKITIDSLLHNRVELSEQLVPIEVKYGQMDFEMEDLVYGLKTNEFTKPLDMGNGFVIYFLKEKKFTTFSNQAFSDNYREASKRLRNKKTKMLYDNFRKDFYKNKKANAVEEQFSILTKELESSINKIYEKDNSQEKVILYYEDLLSIEKRIPSENLSKPLINIEGNEISLSEFIHYLGFSNFKIESNNISNLPFVLNGYIKDFIEMEFLSIAAYGKGYANLPEIKKELSVWEENYQAQIYKNRIIDSVKTDFNKNYKPKNNLVTEVQINEVTLTNLDQVKSIFDNIEEGFTLEGASNKLGIPKSNSKFNGIDYIPIFQTGSYQETINQMKNGDIFGPYTTSNGFSIIQLIDKREIISDSLSALAESQNLFNQLENTLKEKTANLAKRNNITIDEELLKSIKVSEVNMYTYRKFGFGGTLSAVPFINIFYEWKETYDKLKDISL